MKLFTNLPGNLRILFGALQFVVVCLAPVWLLTLTFNAWIEKHFVDDPKLIFAVGELSLRTEANALSVVSNTAQPGSLVLHGLRGSLQSDLLSNDPALVSAVRWTIIPAMLAFVLFSWRLFGFLRSVCANIERGDVFSETNFRLIRGIGALLIAYSLVSVPLAAWASHIMGGYLIEHVSVTGLSSGSLQGTGTLHFSLSPQQLPQWGGLITGLLVLMISEAFRQGLTLKAENDLTV